MGKGLKTSRRIERTAEKDLKTDFQKENRRQAGRGNWKRAGFALLLILAAVVTCFQAGSVVRELFSGNPQAGCGFGTVKASAVPGEEDTVIRQGDPSLTRTAITCNVDWGEDVLPDILDTLEERKVKITFFVSGKWAKRNPDLFRRMYLAGHEIQSHGYSHKLCSSITKEETRQEMEKTSDVFSDLIGQRPTVFAPPSGDYNSDTVDLCREMGCRLSLWSADTIDWRPGSTAEVIKNRVLKKNLHGGIILMHPKPETAKALSGLIDEIREQGLTVVPLRELEVY